MGQRAVTTYRPAADADWPAIKLLLNDSDLPLAGARTHLPHFIIYTRGDEVVGCVGAEVHGKAALLRSLAVAPAAQNSGVGSGLIERLLSQLRLRGVHEVALLTTTAEHFFAERGFAAVAREDIPEILKGSEEFKGACPASATAMKRSI